jgi:uncharacterized membrane protein HdeD (DUF308 family)
MHATDEQFAEVEVLWDLESLRRGWGWFVTLGAILVIVGSFALASQVIASLVTSVMIGWLLLFAGMVEILGAAWIRRLSGLFLHMLSGALLTLIGALFMREPLDAGLALAMLLAGYLIIGAIFRVTAAATYQYTGWGWGMVSGSLELVLGTVIWLAWPAGGFWMLGLFVGISLMFRGFSWIGLGLAVRGNDWGAGAKRMSNANAISPVIPPPSYAGR